MGRYAELINQFEGQASSPDKNILGRFNGGRHINVEFVGESYYRYENESQLEAQLEWLGQQLWVIRHRASMDAWQEAVGQEVDVAREPMERRDREFRERRHGIEAEGLSVGEDIRITVRGWREWSVEFSENLLDTLSEEAFLNELHTAISDLLEDYRYQVIELRKEYDEKHFPQMRSLSMLAMDPPKRTPLYVADSLHIRKR